jgi:hypothetical protein
MDQNNSNNSDNSNGDNPNAPESSVLSTDSLLSTNTTASTINPLSNANRPAKDYSAALSILQSRYGTGGHVVSTPKSKPSDKIQKLNAVQGKFDAMLAFRRGTCFLITGTTAQQGGSQSTLVSTPSAPNSRSSEGTSSTAGSSSTVNASGVPQSKKLGKRLGIASLFKGRYLFMISLKVNR